MRCNICDNKLKRIIPDPTARGGIRPCSKCQGVITTISLDRVDNLLGYDDSDASLDIKEVVGSNTDVNKEDS